MSNLFIVHTPFQLFVAQQIIAQDDLRNNILVLGYVYANKHFLDIYKIMIIPELWLKHIHYPGIAGWAVADFHHLFKSIKHIKESLKTIDSIISDNKVGYIYMGDIHNASYQLLSEIYLKKNVKSVFFEEGSTHYHNNPRIIPLSRIKKLYLKLVLDTFLFRKIYGNSYTDLFYFKNRDYNSLPIYKRYSIVPFYHEEYDIILKINKLFSPELLSYLKNEIGLIKDLNPCLFLSEVVIESNPEHDSKIKHESIKEFFRGKDITTMFVKFHPRENTIDKAAVLDAFSELGIKTIVIAKDINIPVEYYFQYIRFERVYTFFASTIFYNGYIFEKTNFYTLLPLYYSIHKQLGGRDVAEIESVLKNEKYMNCFYE